MQWWGNLSSIQRALWAIGTFSSVLLVLQLGLSFLGLEHHVGFAHDAPDQDAANAPEDQQGGQPPGHHIPMLRYFTIRDAIAFLTGLGWGGLMLISWGLPEWLAVIGGLTIGLSFAAVVVLLMWLLSSLASSGSINLRNAIDRQGEVTLSIPAHGEGCGKMLLSIQGRTIEIEAYTPGNAISRGTRVRVIRLEGSGMLFVEPVVNANA
jgi:membrane protein implicated in regulation of membrane protease activity